MIVPNSRYPLLAAAALGLLIPGLAAAQAPQQASASAQRAENVQATEALRARIDATQARVDAARTSRKITRSRATALGRQIAQTQRSMTRLGAQQGFVSAAELASYNRTLGEIDLELDRRGVERSYGNDMLPAAR